MAPPSGSGPDRSRSGRVPASLEEVETCYLGHPEPVTLPRLLPGREGAGADDELTVPAGAEAGEDLGGVEGA
jgi:hypothetical protein